MKKKKVKAGKLVLVTGGAGYLGSVVVEKLLALGYRIRVVDNLMFGDESLSEFVGLSSFELVEADIRDEDSIRASLEKVWGVVHLAALVGEPACETREKEARAINVEATRGLVRFSKDMGVMRFVLASTCSNYGVTKVDEEVDELYPLEPISVYARTKIEAEKIVLSAKTGSFCPVVLRLGTLFGMSKRMRFNLLVNEFVRDMMLKKSVEVYQPDVWRPYLEVGDAVEGIRLVFEGGKNKVCGEVFNLVGENWVKADLVKLLKDYFPQAKVKVVEGKGIDRRDYRVSGNKIKRVLGFEPGKTIKDGILEMKTAIQDKTITNPYDSKYSDWVNEEKL